MASAICATKFLSRKEVGQQARVMIVCVSECVYVLMHARQFPLDNLSSVSEEGMRVSAVIRSLQSLERYVRCSTGTNRNADVARYRFHLEENVHREVRLPLSSFRVERSSWMYRESWQLGVSWF